MKWTLLLCVFLQSCSLIREYPRRSELTLKARAANSVADDGGERSAETTLELKGNNRDVLAAYRNALDFTLEKLGLLPGQKR